MKTLYHSPLYIEELKTLNNQSSGSLDFLNDKTILISGATGLIGSYLIDALLIKSKRKIKIYGITRNPELGYKRFAKFKDDPRLTLINLDLKKELSFDGDLDYIIHLASKTSPHQYANEVIDTLMLSVLSTYHLLTLATLKKAEVLFFSSVEVYGTLEKDYFKETDFGYLNPLDLRSNYNLGKQTSENLCLAFTQEKDVKVKILRLGRVFGPTRLNEDKKVMSQFINKAILEQDLILKSEGNQVYTYVYVGDVILSALFILQYGQDQETYNVGNTEEHSLKEYAEFISEKHQLKVIYDFKKEDGVSYSKALRAVLDLSKITSLGFKNQFPLFKALLKTIEILKSLV